MEARSMPTRVAVIGATGSIGAQALDIIGRFPREFELVGAVAGRRVAALQEALAPFPAAKAILIDPDGPTPKGVSVGIEAACQLAASPEADVVLVGGGGAGALLPTLAACRPRSPRSAAPAAPARNPRRTDPALALARGPG